MDTTTLHAIESVGFPIVATIVIAGFIAFIIKWLMARFEKLYEDHQSDLKKMFEENYKISDAFNKTVRDIANKHSMETQKNWERDTQYRTRVITSLSNLQDGHKEICNILLDINNGHKKTKKESTKGQKD